MLQTPVKPALGMTRSESISFAGGFDVPADGGYSFTLLTSLHAAFKIDRGAYVLSPHAQPQVCGAPGDAVRPLQISVVLRKGRHTLFIQRSRDQENAKLPTGGVSEAPVVLWEGPGMSRQLLHFQR